MQAPCKDCKNRNQGCHSRCLAYIDFVQHNEAQRMAMGEKKAAANELRSYKRMACEKTRRKYAR